MDRTGPPRNSPLAMGGVLALVLTVVGVVALVGNALRPVRGTAMPVPGVAAEAASTRAGAPPAEPRPRPVVALGSNPLLDEGMALPRVVCELPRLGSSAAAMRAYYDAALGCLDETWRPVLSAAGEPFERAGLNIAAQSRSRCGEMPTEEEATAFYCGADDIVYMPRQRLLDYLGLYEPAHLSVLAHEYGHHVQSLSGMLTAVGQRLEGVAEGTPEELELTRRIELQANCFAGLFVAAVAGRGSVSLSDAQAAVADFRNSVDSETHGTVEHQLSWAETGFEAETTAACNTWDAPAGDVA